MGDGCAEQPSHCFRSDGAVMRSAGDGASALAFAFFAFEPKGTLHTEKGPVTQ